MNRGRHRKINAVMEFLKKKPIQILGIGALAFSVVAVSLPHSSYAAPSLTNYGTGYPASAAGAPNGTGGIAGGQTVYPMSGSTELPAAWQGRSSGKNVADGSFFLDHWGKVVGPSGQSVDAYSLHVDVNHTNTGQQLTGNNGFEDIMGSEIDSWIANVDGYDGSGSAQEQAFDQLLKGEVTSDEAYWATSKNGTGQFTVYDLPNLIADVGGSSGQYVGPFMFTGPKFQWTSAPQAKVSVPSGQTISAGKAFNFDGEAAIMSYNAIYHFEWAQVVDSNGQAVAGAKVNLANKAGQGLGGGITGSGIYLDPTQPQPQDRMQEVNGGTTTPGGLAPRWFYWNDGNGESGYGATTPSTHDTIALPSGTPDGTYTIQYYVSDWYNRVSDVASTTFNVGSGSNSGITLTASNATPAVGTPVTLTANVTKLPPAGDTYHIQIRDMSGSTLSGSSTQNGANNVNPDSTSATSQTPVTENYTAYLVDTTTGNSVASNQVNVTWANGGGGGGGLCPAPYDKDIYWRSDGQGGDVLHWTYDEPYPVYRTEQRCSGSGQNRSCWNLQVFDHCADKLTPMQQAYPSSLSDGQITALSYDPGSPTGGMWLPVSEQQWQAQNGPGSLWYPSQVQHDWDGYESPNGGPNASQVTGSKYINGVKYYSYGPGQGSGNQPWAYARPGSGFGFRLKWIGSPHSLPTNNNAIVTYTMVNPDGTTRQWKQKLVINSDTLDTQGTQMVGLNQPPPFASEYISCWTDIPKSTKGLNGPELAAWSLSGNPQTVFTQGAKITATVTLDSQNAGTVTQTEPNMIVLFSYPAWFFNSVKSVTIGGTTYTGTGPAQDGQ